MDRKIEQLIESTHQKEKNRISIFSHNSVIGHVIGRATINPKYSTLFHRLLSYEGVEFYGVPVMDIEEALHTYDGCIPVINYDDDDAIDAFGNRHADQLYVLSENSSSLAKRSEKKSFLKPLVYKDREKEQDFTLFLLSNTDRTNFVVQELMNCSKEYGQNIDCRCFSYREDINILIDEMKETLGCKKLLLLSDEVGSDEHQDAEVFLALMELKKYEFIKNEIEIYVEIVNLNNVVPIKNLGIASVVLSNKIISLFMLQLLTHQGSRKFFKDILTSNGTEGQVDLEIVQAEKVLEFSKDTISFSCYSEAVQSFYFASNKRRMLLGCFPYDAPLEEIQFFCNKMDEKRDVILRKKDELILISYDS